MPRYVRVPQNERLREIIDGFKRHWGFPQAVAAIDGTHIPILWPQDSASDYYSRQGYYSLLMQAVVDFQGLFIDVNIGWPGKIHDARVFANSSCYRKATMEPLFLTGPEQLEG